MMKLHSQAKARARKRRGSAMVLTILLTIATTTALCALTTLITSTARVQARWEREIKLRYSFEGLVAKTQTEIGSGDVRPPAVLSETLNGITWSLNVQSNDGTIRRSYKIDGSTSDARGTFKKSAVTSDPYATSVFYYALSSGSSLSLPLLLSVGPNGQGGVYVDGTMTCSVLSTIGGVLSTTSSLLPSGVNVLGGIKTNSRKIPIGAWSKDTYLAAADTTITAASLSGITFATPYQLHYHTGNLTVNGSVTGIGTIFVDGDLLISGNLTYADANSLVAFIVTGHVRVQLSTTRYVGYYFAGNRLRIECLLPVTLEKGAAYTVSGMDQAVAATFTFDPRVKNDQLLGEKLKLPSYWP